MKKTTLQKRLSLVRVTVRDLSNVHGAGLDQAFPADLRCADDGGDDDGKPGFTGCVCCKTDHTHTQQ